MKARITDPDALQAISPAALRAYVVSQGWSKLEPYGTHSEVYVNGISSGPREIIVPFTKEIADYSSAVASAVRQIAEFEGRDELSVYSDLTRADRDVIRVRAPEADDDGSIELDPGVEIVQHARDMLASAACAALEPRRAYHLGKVQQASAYMRRVRLGQTEQGSFVVTLLAPIPPTLSTGEQPTLWPAMDAEPYERKVTRVLAQALHSAHEAIIANNRGDGLAAFTSAVLQGVSANLCEALASIVDQAQGADVSLTWARTRPTPSKRDHITFQRSDAETLREAGRELRLHEPRRDEPIIGYVTELHREEGQADGRVIIKAIVDGKPRSLAANLSSADYDIAYKAHGLQTPISMIADIEMTGQRWRLTEPRDLRVMNENE